MKNYEVWTEGYIATGQRGYAQYHGCAEAESFEEACKIVLGDRLDKDRLSVWGCRCFENEKDASKSFG